MGLINTVNDWITSRYEKKVKQMEDLGLCPDCHGRGFHTFNTYELYFTNPVDCIGCNGSGNFAEWYEGNQ
ncbi:methionine aminopeptidase [Bacillus sp. PS06]|uniref:methionine aminopeptidase n=1 Tax=Bacillus sp. PS06 TaxID=2764176 RepID=UPI0017809067|nr:methionine aminopeptidase [Bacillus sp. PS06]MBD8067458.1 methionine aminopeptidase [Bacillus sp. PS06]